MQLLDNLKPFLSIVRLGIGHNSSPIEGHVDWQAIKSLANQHGLSAILLDGIERLPESQRPPKALLLEWVGEVLQTYEYRYEQYRQAISDLSSWYNSHGFKMMLLKGLACSLNWPKPEHRPCGDIDIWLFGKQKEADILLKNEQKVIIDSSHHHHTVFWWHGFSVENHFDFINVHHHKSNKEIERIFKQLGQEDSHWIVINGEIVYLPSPNLLAFFLLRHSMMDFVASELTLRQVLDWAFFVEKHAMKIDWDWLLDILDKYHMRDFFNCINAICVEDLGFQVEIFPLVQFDPQLKNNVQAEILCPKYPRKGPTGFVEKYIYKFCRWRSNKWKHDLCYNESMWSAFWSIAWSHLRKP